MELASWLIPIGLFAYLVLIDYVHLGSFNDIDKLTCQDKLVRFIWIYLPTVGVAVCNGINAWPSQIIAVALSGFLVVLSLYWWWLPYLFGCTEVRSAWWEDKYGDTTRILPRLWDHPVPDLQHMLATGIIGVMFAFSLLPLIDAA